jgi:two-component system sensor histidine kinase/response regulator
VIVKPQLETKKLKIQTDISSNLTVFVDPDHLNIIVRNIINNAIKFSLNNGIIMIAAQEENNKITLKIKDEGIGISEEKIKRFFEVVQTPSFGTAGERGAGLGLVLVNDLIIQNNGNITVKSKLGEGSTFNITLPIGKEHQPLKVFIMT